MKNISKRATIEDTFVVRLYDLSVYSNIVLVNSMVDRSNNIMRCFEKINKHLILSNDTLLE